MSPIKRPKVLRYTKLVRLSAEDLALCGKLAKLYNGTRSDVLRAGLRALMREHEYRESHPPSSTDTDG